MSDEPMIEDTGVETVGPGPEPIDACPAAVQGLDDEEVRQQVQADLAAGRTPHPPVPPVPPEPME
jgi:hypothetical protein